MSDPKQTYQYEAICTVDYDGLYCDDDCLRCREVAAERAQDRADDLRGWQ